MLIRISLILAIIAALAAGTLNILQVRDKITTLVTDRDTQRANRITAENEKDKAKKEQAKAEKDLDAGQSGIGGCEVRARQGGCHRRGADQTGR